MTIDRLLTELRAMSRQHMSDRDGGYALVGSILSLGRSLEAENRDLLRTVLLHLVESDDALSGVAWEALVEDGAPATAPALKRILTSRTRSEQSHDRLVVAILRLGGTEPLSFFIDHVRVRLKQNKRDALVALAQLFRIAPRDARDLAAEFFARVLMPEHDSEWLVSAIPGLVIGIARAPTGFPLTSTARISTDSASRLGRMVTAYLAEPFASKQVGADTVVRLQNEVKEVEH